MSDLKKAEGFSKYWVSEDGKVYNCKTGRCLKPFKAKTSKFFMPFFNLATDKNCKYKNITQVRIVALAHLRKPFKGEKAILINPNLPVTKNNVQWVRLNPYEIAKLYKENTHES